MFVHCLTSHNGQKLTFTSSRKPVGTRSKMITRIGRHPWIVEIVEFLHPQSKQISLWTLPTTACLVCVCDCLKADQAEKSEWWCLYQCMGRIRQEFYRDSQRIQNAFETVALELTGDKWKPSQTFFQKHPSQTRWFSCSLQAVFGDWSHAIFQNDLLRIAGSIFVTCFGSVDFYTPFALISLLTTIIRSSWPLRQFRLRNTFAMLTTPICCQLQTAFFMDIFDHRRQIHKTHHGYQLWHFSVVGSQWLDPFWPKQ